MKDLAVVMLTCDKYEAVWDTWYHYFKKYWKLDVPVYFINDKLDCPFDDMTQIKVDIPEIELWTKKLRVAVEQIPEQHLFILLEDLFFNQSIDDIFMDVYATFKALEADALRILMKPTHSALIPIHRGLPRNMVRRLHQRDKYLIAYSPNIWDKDYLLEALQVDENPWHSEVKGTKRMWDKGKKIYEIELTGWYTNSMRLGKIQPEGQRLINEAKNGNSTDS